MYVLKVKKPEDVEATFYGPFGTVERAHEYAKSIEGWSRCVIKTEPLVVPHNIVKQIVWRSNDN